MPSLAHSSLCLNYLNFVLWVNAIKKKSCTTVTNYQLWLGDEFEILNTFVQTSSWNTTGSIINRYTVPIFLFPIFKMEIFWLAQETLSFLNCSQFHSPYYNHFYCKLRGRKANSPLSVASFGWNNILNWVILDVFLLVSLLISIFSSNLYVLSFLYLTWSFLPIYLHWSFLHLDSDHFLVSY